MDRFPELYSPRLILRKIQYEDVPALVQYANNPNISEHILNIPYPYREPEAAFRIAYVAQGFKQKSRYVFAIILKEREELIGEISLHISQLGEAQLGFWVGEPFWNQGIATEASARMLQFGFEKLGLERIYASHDVSNPASGKVLIKNGFIQQGQTGNLIQFQIRKERL